MGTKSIKVIYHKDCNDGIAAAAAVDYHYRYVAGREPLADDSQHYHEVYTTDSPIQSTIHFHEADYRDVPPSDLADWDMIYVVDFSYPREVLEAMYEQNNNLVVIDHHASAQRNLEGLPYATFDMNECGASLTWKTLGNGKMPRLIELVRDRDLWQGQYEETDALYLYLQAYMKNRPGDLEPYFDEAFLRPILQLGQAMVGLRDQQVRDVVEPLLNTTDNHIIVEIDGQRGLAVNSTVWASEIGNQLATAYKDEYQFVLIYKDNQFTRECSLRSVEGGADVSRLAECYGGGGHPRAAGFAVGDDVFYSDIIIN